MRPPHRLLFVCTANICRSPMAEALARRYAEERRLNIEVQSAGVQAMTDSEAAANAVRVIRELGADLSSHRAQPMTEELVAWADRILVMELRHANDIRESFEKAQDKVQLLGNFGGMMEIEDPYGRWIFAFRRSRNDIQRCVEHLIDRLPANPL